MLQHKWLQETASLGKDEWHRTVSSLDKLVTLQTQHCLNKSFAQILTDLWSSWVSADGSQVLRNEINAVPYAASDWYVLETGTNSKYTVPNDEFSALYNCTGIQPHHSNPSPEGPLLHSYLAKICCRHQSTTTHAYSDSYSSGASSVEFGQCAQVVSKLSDFDKERFPQWPQADALGMKLFWRSHSADSVS